MLPISIVIFIFDLYKFYTKTIKMNFKKLFMLLCIAVLFATCKESPKGTVETFTDDNGYNYETVKGDIFKTRIYTLKNGLKVYLAKNDAKPKIYTMIAVRVGAKNDPRETTGLAHYFEHIMFKGTDEIGTTNWEEESKLIKQISDLFEEHKNTDDPEKKKEIYAKIDSVSGVAATYSVANEYDKMVANIGALGTNAFTGNDMTAYINEIPSNEMDRWLKIEKERFKDPIMRLFHTELETVYEEFNMGQDNDYRYVNKTLMEKLFPTHPYGTSVLGEPEHLKNPSMVNIQNFKDKYYVANNMAMLLMGDLDYDATIKKIDEEWGDFAQNPELDQNTFIEEKDKVKSGTYEISSPDQEFVMIGYRGPKTNTKEAKYLKLIDMILNNSEAGLIDLDLIKKQKVTRAYSSFNDMNDYSVFSLQGYPIEGQKLEETKDLLMGEIEKIKKGEFDDWLTDAIINSLKLRELQFSESNYGVFEFLYAFIGNYPWKDKVVELDELAKITKEELVNYANEFFNDDQVIIYKSTGENPDKVKVDKPKISPFDVNRDSQSEFYSKLESEKPKDIKPVFIDYKEKIQKEELQKGVDFYFTQNTENDRAYLYYILEMGKLHDLKLALAFDYLKYLGTENYSADDLSKEFYKIGISKNAFSQDERSFIYISGLDENLEKGVKLIEELLNSAKVDKEAYVKFIDNIVKKRQNNKLNKSTILWDKMYNYAQYGEKSPTTHILSEEEMKAIDPQELLDLVKSAFSYEHLVYYYGPRTKEDAKELIKTNHKIPENLQSIKEPIKYIDTDFNKNEVYFCNYDMVQTQIILLSKDVTYNLELLPEIRLFNEYYGGTMGSIIFQEMREARGLAYSAYAGYRNATKKEDYNYIFGFIATQPDKADIALAKFSELLNEMPQSDKAFNEAKKNIVTNINSQRIIRDEVFWNYLNNKRKGIENDPRKDVYEKVQNFTQEDLNTFFNERIKGKKYKILILGNKNDVDFNVLKKYGEIKELTLEQIFNY